ncbi:MAG: hypothetical protein HGA39_09210 [Coriobacteriia bacterium]|nr:hypothetical protein [Coriobacteriia bacterium]
MSPDVASQILLMAVIIFEVVAILLLKARDALNQKSALVTTALSLIVLWLGVGAIQRYSTLAMLVAAIAMILALLGQLAFFRLFRPDVYRAPGGATFEGLLWDEQGILSVIRAEDPARIAGQPDELAVYSVAAKQVFAVGRPKSLADETAQVAGSLREALDDANLVSKSGAQRVARALVKLAAKSPATAQNIENA